MSEDILKSEVNPLPDYIRWIRDKVSHEPIILAFAGACITNEAGEIMLQKRKPDQEIWSVPGGALEYGESADEALKREVREETGLEISVDELIGIYSKYFMEYENGDVAQVVSAFFKCSVTGGRLWMDQQETFALEYFNRENIPPLFNPQQLAMIMDYFNGAKGIFR